MLPQTLLSHIISKAEVTSNQTEQKKDTIFWLGSSYPFSKSGSSEQNGKNLTWNLNLKEWVKKLCLFLCSILSEVTGVLKDFYYILQVQAVLKMKKLAPKHVLKTRNIDNITSYAYLELSLLLAKLNSVSEYRRISEFGQG